MTGAAEIAAALGLPEPTGQQKAVIEAGLRPSLVLAGAGSGKTETMANRVVYLLANGQVAPVLHYQNISVDPVRRIVMRGDQHIRLSMHEFRTLLALMERQGRVVPRSHLEDLIYGGSTTIESNTIAVYVHQLRRKLGDSLIATVHGYGYRLGPER